MKFAGTFFQKLWNWTFLFFDKCMRSFRKCWKIDVLNQISVRSSIRKWKNCHQAITISYNSKGNSIIEKRKTAWRQINWAEMPGSVKRPEWKISQYAMKSLSVSERFTLLKGRIFFKDWHNVFNPYSRKPFEHCNVRVPTPTLWLCLHYETYT